MGAYLALAFFFVLREVHLGRERELPRAPEDGGLRGHAGRRTEERENSRSYTQDGLRAYDGYESPHSKPVWRDSIL